MAQLTRKKFICMFLAAALVVGVFAYADRVTAAKKAAEAAAKEAVWEEARAKAQATKEEALLETEKVRAERAEKEAEKAEAARIAEAKAAREAAAAKAEEERLRKLRRVPYTETEAEKKISSYVQLPLKEYPDPRWAGYWSDLEAGGQKFYSFGCGICSLSNVVSTLTAEDVNPARMFRIAQEKSSYSPKKGQGAIDWTQMAAVLDAFSLKNEIKKKPADYRRFKEDVAASDATIALLCKDDDDSLWFYTNGHYITLWQYDPADGTVFVSDSAGLYNRRRVSLIAIWKALKTRSTAQYLCVKK